MLHISDIKKYDRCEKLFWLSQKDPQPRQPYVYYHEDLVKLLKEKFHITDAFEGHVGDDPCLAIQAMECQDILINARFAYGELRIKIPLMMRKSSVWDLYFTYGSCYPKESEAQVIFDHLEVLRLLGISVGDIRVVHLQADYIRKDRLDADALLTESEYLYNHKNKAHKKITELLAECHRDLPQVIGNMQELLRETNISAQRSSVCTRGMKCPYIDTCFPQPPKDTSIMHLISCSARYEMQNKGILDIKDVDLEKIEGTRQQFSQIMAARSDTMHFDALAVRTWIDSGIHYPLSYLDFEWETYAYPPYEGMKPFDVLCFQYSLHIEKQPGDKLIHKEFLEQGDCREKFICRLLEDLPKEGSIMVFNMEGAEKLRLHQLKEQFPQYGAQLDAVCDRMVDLALPFSTASIYDSRMRGLFSLKTLVPIFSSYSYEDLDISYGMDAVRNWRRLESADADEVKSIRRHLLEYCAMDTYAEVLVYHAITEILEEKERAMQLQDV